jgi:mono/diheme cytochrome c family protein
LILQWTFYQKKLKNHLKELLKRGDNIVSINKMNTRAARVCFLLLLPGLSVLISGCASRGPLTVRDASYPVAQIDARGLFEENCIVCHGENGRAHTFHGTLFGAQNLTDSKWQLETTDAEIIDAIKTGPSVMPAFGKKLSPAEIEALAAFVRTFKTSS